MPEEEPIYISLQEATKFCSYSQEYLSLRARQGKLKAIKFGRNWVTKKEWLEEYLQSVDEYKKNLEAKKIALPRRKGEALSFEVLPPENLPVEEVEEAPTFTTFIQEKLKSPALRSGFAVALVFVLLATAIVFGKPGSEFWTELRSNLFAFGEQVQNLLPGKESFKNVVDQVSPLVYQFNENFDRGVALKIKNEKLKIKNFVDGVLMDTQYLGRNFSEGLAIVIGNWKLEIKNLARRADAYTYILAEASKSSGQVIKDYFSWLGRQTFGIGQKIVEGYSRANDFVEQKLGGLAERIISFPRKIAKTYSAANDWVEEKISNVARTVFLTIKRLFEPRVVRVDKELATEETLERTKKEIIEAMQKEFQELKEVGVPVKEIEVERVIKVEPIKEITKITEVTKIDAEELAKIKKELAQFTLWGADIETLRAITQKLQAHPAEISVPTAPIYVGYQGIQVGGVGTFASLGVSGSAGVASLGVGGSTVLGSNLSDKLMVNATAEFLSPTTIKNTFRVGDTNNYLTISSNGNLTTTGSLSIAGDLTVSGAQNFVGPTAISYSGTSTALTVKQSGVGDIIRFLDGENIVFKISDGGQLTLTSTSTPQLTIRYDGTGTTTLALDSSGTTTLYSTGNIILNPVSGEIRTSANFVDVGGATARAVGERVFRAAASIFRYSIPAETASTSWIRISKDFPSGSSHPLVSDPAVLSGATRVYRLLINYSDDLATASTSSWRVATSSSGATIVEFSLPGLNASTTLNESKPHLTEELPIPNDNWQVDVKVPSGKKIRVFNIFLLAYDKINQ